MKIEIENNFFDRVVNFNFQTFINKNYVKVKRCRWCYAKKNNITKDMYGKFYTINKIEISEHNILFYLVGVENPINYNDLEFYELKK